LGVHTLHSFLEDSILPPNFVTGIESPHAEKLMNTRNYNALVTTSAGTSNFRLKFDAHPTVGEVLNNLYVVAQSNGEALPLIANITYYAHVVGQENELFNESTIFHYARDGAWLRIFCPLYSNED
jgi:hypothetical protein